MSVAQSAKAMQNKKTVEAERHTLSRRNTNMMATFPQRPNTSNCR